MSYCEAIYYYQAGRSIHTLSEASHVKPWRNLTRDLDKLGVGLRIVELLNALFLDGDPHERLFDRLTEILARLDTEHERPHNLWPYFQLLLAAELGFEPAFDREQIESVSEVGVLSLADGRVVAAYDNGCVRVERGVLRAFAILSRSDLETSMRLRLEPAISRKLDHLVESYLRYHVERAYPTRAAAVIDQLAR
jgi:DNA repair protein RecO (recombination protein O)